VNKGTRTQHNSSCVSFLTLSTLFRSAWIEGGGQVGPKDFRLVAHDEIDLGVVNEDWALADSGNVGKDVGFHGKEEGGRGRHVESQVSKQHAF
jgi:hypothetical protein